MTFATASKKSCSFATLRRARIANIPASVATDRSSAPVEFGHNRATRSKRIFCSTDIDLACMRKMFDLPSRSGSENSILRSRRPGRSKAGSNVSGLSVDEQQRNAK